jgi:hypothetical protein
LSVTTTVTGSAWFGLLEIPRFCAVGPGNSSFPPMVSTNLRIFCSCAAEMGQASSAGAHVLNIDVTNTTATSILFIRALIQLCFIIVLRSADPLNANLVGHKKASSPGRRRTRLFDIARSAFHG